MALFTLSLNKEVSAAPVTFTVTNTNDSGAGSLREAINNANSNGNPNDMDTIAFNIPGSQVHTIGVESDLPAITQKVTIDGYSQPGSQVNSSVNPNPINSVIKIEIDAKEANISQAALKIDAEESIIRGVSIYNASTSSQDFSKANLILAANNTRVDGSYIGIKADGFTIGEYGKNCVGIVVLGSQSNQIGGTNPSERNIVHNKCSIAISAAIALGGFNTSVLGNYVGIAKDGLTDFTPEQSDANGLSAPFSTGINLVNGGNNVVGGPSSNQRNVFSGNNASGIVISSANNTIQGNYIGTDYTGKVDEKITNGVGVIAVAGSDSLIGGINPGEGNLIAGTQGSGVEIASLFASAYGVTVTPNRIAILGNSISNIKPFNLLGVGNSNLGIDLSNWIDESGDFVAETFNDRGPTVNDPGDSDNGPNGTINFPVLKSAQQVGNQLTINYDLDANDSPSNNYRIEFYANSERSIFGYGPGEVYLGSANSVSNGNDLSITLDVSGNIVGKALSATTTAIDAQTESGFGSTSEFSQNISIASEGDSDADGIPDSVEDAGPNNGDGNNDGIPDRLQPTVTTYVISGTNIYSTLTTEGCSENGRVSSIDIKTLNAKDAGYDYPFGLTDFTLNCSRGDTVDIELYIHANDEAKDYVPRKYNSDTNVFSDIPGSVLSTVTIGDSTSLKLAYSIEDGGELDDDGEANGVIVDPVGVASVSDTSSLLSPGRLARTGFTVVLPSLIAMTIIALALYTFKDYKRHKKPLKEVDQEMNTNISKSYTYWHHIKVVSIPLAKYRISVRLERKKVVGDKAVV